MRMVLGFLAAVFAAAPASASDVEDECLAASKEWGSAGDVEQQCACVAAAAAGDDTLIAELMEFRSKYSSDSEAYDGASTDAKAVLDQCAVTT